jgi:hypothetical protein
MNNTTQNQRSFILRGLVTHPLLWAVTVLSPTLAAAECTQDSDCAPHQRCELQEGFSTGGCYITEEGEEICEEEVVESISFCVEAPIPCNIDSDCPSHLRCGSPEAPTGTIEVAPVEPADSDAPPPDMETAEVPDELPPEIDMVEPEDEGMMCVFVPEGCEVDSDCADHFRCEVFAYGDCYFPEIECDGEDCPPVAEPDCGEVATEGYCVPQEIECDQDNACPTDWHCTQLSEFACGEGSIGEVEPAPAPVPDPDSREMAPDEMAEELVEAPVPCEEIVRSLCVPVGFGGIVGDVREVSSTGVNGTDDGNFNTGGSGSGNGSTPETALPISEEQDNANDTSNPSIEESNGCDARSRGAQSWAIFALLALFGIRRRTAA